MVKKRPVDQTQEGTLYGVGVHQDRHSGGGCEPGISHSPPMTILISFTVAGFLSLPSQVYRCMHNY